MTDPLQCDAPTLDSVPVFELDVALDRVEGQEEFLDEVIRLFLADAPCRIDEIEQSLSQGHSKRVAAAAHSLKGATGCLGGARASASALRLEQIALSGDLANAHEAFAELRTDLALFSAAISKRLVPR
jgi:two-component system, sensor histidine kinase and response regulator